MIHGHGTAVVATCSASYRSTANCCRYARTREVAEQHVRPRAIELTHLQSATAARA